MKKVIFLDFDGVLNSIDSNIAARAFSTPKHLRMCEVDNVRLGLLKWLCEITDAKIVISSSWRIGRTVDWFCGFFEARGWVLPPIIDLTPNISGHRGEEVNVFLNGDIHYEKYVIFDDDRDFFEFQNLIHVKRNSGLTINHIFQAIDMLGLSDSLTEEEVKSIQDLRLQVEFENTY